MFELPKTMSRTRVSPSMQELEFMYNWCKNNLKSGCNILEFGAGPSTYVIKKACDPKIYIAVEDWIPTIKDVTIHVENIMIINSTWFDIPEYTYDFIFVDSSAGYPPKDGGLHRDEATKYGERMLSNNGHIMLHDWHGRSGKAPRRYLENSGYQLVGSLNDKTGVGIYKKCI